MVVFVEVSDVILPIEDDVEDRVAVDFTDNDDDETD